MSLIGSMIGALMALVPAAKRELVEVQHPEGEIERERDHLLLIGHSERLNRSRRLMIAHIRFLEGELEAERERARHWRDETTRLLAGAHRCQHQADLNRAFAAQAFYPQQQMAQNAQAAQLQAMANYQQGLAQAQGACGLALRDCNMHHAEMIGRLQAQTR